MLFKCSRIKVLTSEVDLEEGYPAQVGKVAVHFNIYPCVKSACSLLFLTRFYSMEETEMAAVCERIL